MRMLDMVFWAFFAFTVAFVAWQFLRLLYETLWERPAAPSKRVRPSATGGVSGGSGEVNSALSGQDSTADATASSSGGDSGGNASATGDMSGGGEYGGGGASGGW